MSLLWSQLHEEQAADEPCLPHATVWQVIGGSTGLPIVLYSLSLYGIQDTLHNALAHILIKKDTEIPV